MDGMIGRWLKREGERIVAGEPLVEIITDKAKFDYESPASGILRKIVAAEKSTVPVGYVIALFAEADEALPDVTAENEAALARYREAAALAKEAKAQAKEARQRLQQRHAENAPFGRAPTAAPRAAAAPPSGVERIRATPSARRLAKEAGINLADIKLPAGKNVISEEDVTAYMKKTSDNKT